MPESTRPKVATPYAYLHTCVTGDERPVRYRKDQALDTVIADQDLVGGFYPEIGEQHTRAISLTGYPDMLSPDALMLTPLMMRYRWSSRFIFMDRLEAEYLIKTRRKYWIQQIKGGAAKVGEMLNGASDLPEEEGPIEMVKDAGEAKADVALNAVQYGHHTMTVVVQDEDKKIVQQKARAIKKQLGRCGFGGRIERANSMEALMGSWPGHGYQNVRREPIHTLNLTDMLPLTSQWAGQQWNTNPLFPPRSPALMLTTTDGGAPFWYSPYLHMVGNVKVLGPIRAGKSFFLALEMAQFRRYPGARIRVFDRGYSATPICLACGGHVHDIGRDATAFAPLAHVDDLLEREWALGYIETLLKLQGVSVTPEQRGILWRALTLMGQPDHTRTMSALYADVQDLALREGLRHYTEAGGAGRLLDAEADALADNDFQVFELEELMSRSKADLIAVLLHLFHRIDRECQDGRPTRIYSDENWRALLEPEFAAQFNSWLRDKPKQNASVVLATQSLEEIAASEYYTIIEESCQTSIFLPNPAAKNENSARLYRKFGLTDRKIERLAEMIPRQEYLYTSPIGDAVFQLQAGPLAQTFCGVTDRGAIAHIMHLATEYGKEWTRVYLEEKRTARTMPVGIDHDGPGATVAGWGHHPGH